MVRAIISPSVAGGGDGDRSLGTEVHRQGAVHQRDVVVAAETAAKGADRTRIHAVHHRTFVHVSDTSRRTDDVNGIRTDKTFYRIAWLLFFGTIVNEDTVSGGNGQGFLINRNVAGNHYECHILEVGIAGFEHRIRQGHFSGAGIGAGCHCIGSASNVTDVALCEERVTDGGHVVARSSMFVTIVGGDSTMTRDVNHHATQLCHRQCSGETTHRISARHIHTIIRDVESIHHIRDTALVGDATRDFHVEHVTMGEVDVTVRTHLIGSAVEHNFAAVLHMGCTVVGPTAALGCNSHGGFRFCVLHRQGAVHLLQIVVLWDSSDKFGCNDIGHRALAYILDGAGGGGANSSPTHQTGDGITRL